MSSSPRAGCLPRVGGALALDFCNSTTGRGGDRFVEHLFDHEDLRRWSVFNELLSEAEAAALEARLDAADAAAGFAEAIAVRALLNRVFDALARSGPADPADLRRLATLDLAHRQGAGLVPAGPAFAWRFKAADADATALLGPILRSATAVLTDADLSRLKACPGDACGWVFLDASKNGSRVWCEMEVCGTRAKQTKRAAARRARSHPHSDPGE